MTGKVRIDESKKEIRNSPGAPSAPANATIFCFQPLKGAVNAFLRKSVRPKRTFRVATALAWSEKRLNRLADDVVSPVQIVWLDHQRRQDINHVAERTQKHTMIQEKAI